MKKLFAMTMVVMLAAALFAGCGTPAASGVKTGLAVVTSIAKSSDATAEAAGVAEAYSTIAAVTVDASGKIVSCVIDAAQTVANFDAAGAVTTPLDTEYQTKNERGEGYGMKGQSSIGKEWNEQAAAFAAYVVGKTAAEVQGIAVEAGLVTDADLAASVTIHVTDFISVVVKAVENAQDLGASADDSLRVAAATSIAGSKNATADAAGVVEAYSYYTALTKDASGKITSCVLDASQAKVTFDATGKVTADLAAGVQTKNELKEAYNMKGNSGIGKEWYEQAAAFAKYVVGKTPADVAGIALDETGHATSADITASVTVHINDFLNVIAKAAK